MRQKSKDRRLFCSRSRWGRGLKKTTAPSGRSYRGASVALSERNSKRHCDSRQGVALIVVLGFLSIMVVMAVAFLTHARMERLVADSTLEAERGRQLVRTALNAAMNDYSRYLDQNHLVMPVLPDDQLFTSIPAASGFGLGGQTIGDDDIQLLVGEVEEWIPRKYRVDLVPPALQTTNMLAGPSIVSNAEWILVREDPTDAQSRILGRYAYACFDMSGGIDANLIAGPSGSDIGLGDSRPAYQRLRRSARDVPMGRLPETANLGVFKGLREGWKGFDSLQGLILLTDGNAEDGNGDDERWYETRKEIHGAGLFSNLVSDLTPYSFSAYRGGRYIPASATWSAPLLTGIITNGDWDATNALGRVRDQFISGWDTWINDAMNDYTNPATILPQGTDYPSPKNVPMFNEINLSYSLSSGTADPNNAGWFQYNMEIRLTFEFWYPFPSTNNHLSQVFQLDAPGVGSQGAGDIRFTMLVNPPPPGMGSPLVIFDPTLAITNTGYLTVKADYHHGTPFVPSNSPSGSLTNFVYTIPIRPMVILPTASGGPPDPNYPFQTGALPLNVANVNLGQSIYLHGPGGTGNADMIPVGLPLSVGTVTLNPGDPPPPSLPIVLEVTDPRFNHSIGPPQGNQWVLSSVPSLESNNNWSAAISAAFQAEGSNMFCRNGLMETPAELGFISVGRPWETVDLCETGDPWLSGIEMMAGLVSDTNLWVDAVGSINKGWASSNVFYTNGTINLNTRSTNVLASAFYDMATHEVPGITNTTWAGVNPISEATANLIAQDIVTMTAAGTWSDACMTGSDWARIPAMQQGGALWSAYGLNNNQRENLIRNTWGLFSPDNSLFTVVMIAQAIKESPGNVGIWNANEDLITGERRAVALVWRDPYRTGSNLHHEMFVRMFRYLND